MEYIEGARVDDLAFLYDHSIDRNKVALELSRIFNQMLYINGFFQFSLVPFTSSVSVLMDVELMICSFNALLVPIRITEIC
jgi:hypothetical protein